MASSVSPVIQPNACEDENSDGKRRKLRKGTFSCTECKRRKIRCVFGPTSTPPCATCQRLGLSCISQGEQESLRDGYQGLDSKLNRIELLVNQLDQKRRQTQRLSASSSSQALHVAHSNSPYSLLATAGQDLSSRCHSLSSYLQTVLPLPMKAALISRRGKMPYEIFRQPVRHLENFTPAVKRSATADQRPSMQANPVAPALKLIRLAMCLQHIQWTTVDQSDLQLGDSAGSLAKRYIDEAHHVLSHDAIVKTFEGLQALALTGCFHLHSGDFSAAWLTFRRTLGIAEVMGVPKQAIDGNRQLAHVWFRLLQVDRFSTLTIGFPLNAADASSTIDKLPAADTVSLRLDHVHTGLCSRVLARNTTMQDQRLHREHRDVLHDHYSETNEIEQALQQAKNALPVSWWTLPSAQGGVLASELEEQTARMITQMHHYYLSVLLYQPYLLFVPGFEENESASLSGDEYEVWTNSKTVLIPASRELLTRYLQFRDFHNKKGPYPGLDHKCFIAVTGLLIAYIGEHHVGRTEHLGKEYVDDIKMVFKAIEILAGISVPPNTELAGCNVEALQKLAAAETDAACGSRFAIWNAHGDNRGVEESTSDDVSFEFKFPFSGTIRIKRRDTDKSSDLFSQHSLSAGIGVPAASSDDVQEFCRSINFLDDLYAADEAASFQDLFTNIPDISETNLSLTNNVNNHHEPQVLHESDINWKQIDSLDQVSCSPEQLSDTKNMPHRGADMAAFDDWLQSENEVTQDSVLRGDGLFGFENSNK